MKHLDLLLLFFLLVPATGVRAQLSDGGTPWSAKFGRDVRFIGFETMPGVNTAALELEDSLNASDKNIPYRFGYSHHVSLDLENSGSWTEVSGGRVWRLGLISPGAVSLNLSFQNLLIPEGGKLFVMNGKMDFSLGAFTQKYVAEDRMLGTELISGDTVIVEYFEPAGHYGESRIEIWRVTHGYRSLVPGVIKAFGDAGNCNNNVNCPQYAPYSDQKRSVICLVNGGEFCSAALVNNTCNDGTPYVLTANHCGSSGFGSWVFRFNWEAPGCPDPLNNPPSQSISGAVNRAASTMSDFRLLEMTQVPPSNYNVYYAGWNRTNTPSTGTFGIHHPSGDIKKISLAPNATISSTYNGASTWRTGLWTDGITEPGSSGSPLFDQDGRIVGQLYGGPSQCGCENDVNCGNDYYGKFYTSWTGGGTNSTRLSNWLGGCNANIVMLNGYDPNVVSVQVDARLVSIISPNSTECNSSITPSVTLKNNGQSALTSADIYYRIDNGPYILYNWAGSLGSGLTANVSLNPATVPGGNHSFKVFVTNPNGGTDQNANNDTLLMQFAVINPNVQSLPLVEGFSGNAFPPSGWIRQNPDNDFTWVRVTNAGGFGNSSSCAAIDHFSSNDDPTGFIDNLVSPYLDFASQASVTLTFNVAYARFNNQYKDSLFVQISTDCGNSWTNVYQKGGTSLATAPDNNVAFVPASAEWRTETVDLSPYTSSNTVLVKFRTQSGWGNWLYIDDINIMGPVVLPTAQFQASSNTICEGQSISYTNQSQGATSYVWTFPGGSPPTSVLASPTINYSTAGNYMVALVAINPGGSDTILQSVLVNPNPVPVITVNGLQLSTGAYVTYQWLYNGNPISGATQQQYLAVQTGNYSVAVTDANNCQGTSQQEFIVNNFGTGNSTLAQSIRIFPNPATDYIYIENQTGLQGEIFYSLYDVTGRTLQQGLLNESIYKLSTGEIATGLYHLSVWNSADRHTWKIQVN